MSDFQVVRMVELLRTFGIFGLYQRGGGLGSEWCRVVICKLCVYLILKGTHYLDQGIYYKREKVKL